MKKLKLPLNSSKEMSKNQMRTVVGGGYGPCFARCFGAESGDNYIQVKSCDDADMFAFSCPDYASLISCTCGG